MSWKAKLAARLRRFARDLDPSLVPKPSDAAILDEMIVHIAHEFVAMEAATQYWTQSNLWIFLEDALLHIRLTADFLWPTSDRFENAVLADHYLAGWRGNSGGPPIALRQLRDALNHQLAHITRERVSNPQDLSSRARELADEIWRGWARFLRLLGADPRADRFRAELTARAATLGIALPANAT